MGERRLKGEPKMFQRRRLGARQTTPPARPEVYDCSGVTPFFGLSDASIWT